MRQLNLRLPDHLHSKLKECAEHDHRSLNSEIIAMLERAVAEHANRLGLEGRGTLAP